MTIREPLQRLRHVARRPAPVTGLARPPRRPLAALRAAAEEAAAGAATLALLDAGPRCCDTLLAELAEHAAPHRRDRGRRQAHPIARQ